MIGHEKIKNNLIEAIENNKFTHAHIFVGEKGIGKSILADEISARLLNLNHPRDHVDIIHWTLDKGKSSIGVNTIRTIVEECNKKPFEGDRKVIIIDSGDKITFQAQNAFLKTIEEPPANVYIFILCEELDGILDTIKSRCCIHKLRPLADKEMNDFMTSKFPDLSEEELKLAKAFGKGVPGQAEKLIKNKDFELIRSTICELIKRTKEIDSEISLSYESFFSTYGSMEDDILDIIITVIRDVIIYKEIGDEDLLINSDKTSEIKDLANIFSSSKLNDMIRIVEETRNTLKNNVNSSLAFITMVLRMQEV
ncbi:MAG: DNA polymerase III subunit delta' [Clostridium sp.]|nr:DNA polymerase III subunit delta' [Clostridium sp.]MDU7085675.1 DNA polymerase III subunit delta' [Clostridium sp.]